MVSVDAGRRDRARETLQQLERREEERAAGLEIGLGQPVEEPRVGGDKRLLPAEGVEAFQRDGPRAR